jgi:hypothetical protein
MFSDRNLGQLETQEGGWWVLDRRDQSKIISLPKKTFYIIFHILRDMCWDFRLFLSVIHQDLCLFKFTSLKVFRVPLNFDTALSQLVTEE